MIERLVALATLVASAAYLFYALRMPLGAAARPGAGFYPAAVGAFACGVALVVTAIAFRRAATGGRAIETTETAHDGRGPVRLAVITLAGFTLLMPWIGYPLAALLFVAALLRQLGASWRSALLTAVLSAEGSYYLFAILLGVSLPKGFWPH
jgi:putative tricarboxylic transport membrane protein